MFFCDPPSSENNHPVATQRLIITVASLVALWAVVMAILALAGAMPPAQSPDTDVCYSRRADSPLCDRNDVAECEPGACCGCRGTLVSPADADRSRATELVIYAVVSLPIAAGIVLSQLHPQRSRLVYHKVWTCGLGNGRGLSALAGLGRYFLFVVLMFWIFLTPYLVASTFFDPSTCRNPQCD